MAVVQEEVGPILIIDAVEGMERLDALLPRDECAQIGRKGLAVPSKFRVRRVAEDVVQQILRNLRFGSERQAGAMREAYARVDETLVAPFVFLDVAHELIQIPLWDIVAPYFCLSS